MHVKAQNLKVIYVTYFLIQKFRGENVSIVNCYRVTCCCIVHECVCVVNMVFGTIPLNTKKKKKHPLYHSRCNRCLAQNYALISISSSTLNNTHIRIILVITLCSLLFINHIKFKTFSKMWHRFKHEVIKVQLYLLT